MKIPIRKILTAMLLGVAIYGGFAVWRGLDALGSRLAAFSWWSFAAACALAFGNYMLRFIKWEFYLGRLGIVGVRKLDSLLTFLSGFILTVTPGKVGEVFKSLVLRDIHDVPVPKTAPIVVAERITDVIGIVVLIVVGSLGFSGGLAWAGAGAALVGVALTIVASRSLSMRIIGMVERMPGKIGRLAPKLSDAYESLATLVKPSNLILPTIVSIAAWMLECLSLWVILGGFGEQTSVPLAMFFYATSTLAGALVPVPGGLGVTEGALQGQLMEIGHVPEDTSTGAMILVRFATLWFAVFVGFMALTWLKRRHPTLFSKSSEAQGRGAAESGEPHSEGGADAA